MTDLLSIAQSGVRAYSRALDVVAGNVANAATPGHVRRTTTLVPAALGGNAGPLELDPVGGAGVRLASVGRAFDALQADTLRRAESDVATLGTARRWLTTLQSALTGSAGLDQPLTDMFASLSDLATDPTNPALRQTFLARADALADRFNTGAADLERLQGDLRKEADVELNQLNALASGLAEVNAQLRRATPGSGTSAGLADERDRLLAQMSVIVGIDVQLDARGMASVRIPDSAGPALVDGSQPATARLLSVSTGFELRVGPEGDDEMATVMGGVFAGLTAARTSTLQAQERLDYLATSIAEDFNRLHQQGVDLLGADGEALFRTAAPEVTGAAANGGSARVDASLADGATLAPSTLVFNGTDWRLENAGGSVTGALPLTLDGLTVSAAGAAVNGDVYRIGPARPAAAMALRPLSAQQIATSARWLAEPGQLNTGTATAELKVGTPSGTPAAAPFTVTVLAGGQAELRDGAGALLASGPADGWLGGDGFSVRLSGKTLEGDSFRIERSGADEGNNGNAAALLSLRDRTGPAGTYGDASDAMTSAITVSLAETRARAAIAARNRDGAAESLQRSSGVDLNTEAADMLRLQQAFQANARIIQTARETFEAILAAGR